MEIFERRPAPVRIGEMDAGSLFEREGRYYMVAYDEAHKAGYTSAVVSMATGMIVEMSNDAEVRAVSGKLTVWEDDDE